MTGMEFSPSAVMCSGGDIYAPLSNRAGIAPIKQTLAALPGTF